MPSNVNASTNTVAKDAVAELTEILKQWEEEHTVPGSDPTPHLIKLCELFELHTLSFLKRDPDPFDDRHPVTSDPEGALGQILRALLKRDVFITKLVNHYLRDNYFSSQGHTRDSTPVNTAACRLMLDLLQGLDIPQVFRDGDSTVSKLFTWAEKAPEPLRTYATGLLAAAVDIPDIATNFRDSNAHLLPIMLNRLWDLKDEGEDAASAASGIEDLPARPFAHLNGDSEAAAFSFANNNDSIEKQSPSETHSTKFSPRNLDRTKNNLNSSGINADSFPCTLGIRRSSKSNLESLNSSKNNADRTSERVPSSAQSPCKLFTAASPASNIASPAPNSSALMNSSFLNSDCSNSSWAEMSSYILGSYQMHPVTRDTKVLFILKYLRPVGEYQESLGNVFEYRALDLIFHYINVRKTCHARLSFEALRFLGSLLFHKKFCLEFVNRGGVQMLMQIPRPSLPADGVALCLWYLGYCEEAIERMCMLPDNVLESLIKYALWLIESGHPSGCTHSIMFFGLVFRFRAILDRFDQQDGLRKLVNVMSTMSILQNLTEEDAPDDPDEGMMWQRVKHVCLTVKNYFEAHLAIRAHHTSYQRSLSSNHSATPCYKPLNVSWESVTRNVEALLEGLPLRARWEPVENFLKLNGVSIFLQVVAVVLNNRYSTHRPETAVSALDTLYICSVMPQVQMAFCEKITIPASEDFFRNVNPMEAPGFAVLVACIPETNIQPMNATPEVQRAALHVLVNCLCAPLNRSGGASFRSVDGTPSGRKTARSSAANSVASEDIVTKSWDCVRTSNGIMYLLSLLHKKLPITDADCTRALACRALVGLSRSEAARQIMSKLPMFTQGQLQLLMREPILQEKRADHVKFQRYGLELINAVSGKASGGAVATVNAGVSASSASVTSDISLLSIHKADVVAQTRIGYNKRQLLQLMQMHLVKEGLHNAAMALQLEAGLPPLPHPCPMPPPLALTATPAPRNRHLGTPGARNIFSPLARPSVERPSPSTTSTPTSAAPNSSSARGAPIGSGLPSTSAGPTPLSIRPGRGLKRSADGRALPNPSVSSDSSSTDMSSTPVSSTAPNSRMISTTRICSTPTPSSRVTCSPQITHSRTSGVLVTPSRISTPTAADCAAAAASCNAVLSSSKMSMVPCSTTSYGACGQSNVPSSGISLDGIVREYLTNQHALCQNPVVTCPTFDLFHPHRCPEPRTNRIIGAYNIAHRITHRSYSVPRLVRAFGSYHGNMRGSHNPGGGSTAYSLKALDRKFIYGRYRPSEIIRPTTDGSAFTTNCFSADNKGLFVGTMRGEIILFNLSNPTEEALFTAHQGSVNHLSIHKSGSSLLSSCASVSEAVLWNLDEVYTTSEPKFHIPNCQYATFSSQQDKILATMDTKATLLDIATQAVIRDCQPTLSNHYQNNRADIHPHDELVLTDGVLFDVRSGREIHKFDKINPLINGRFHRNGLEVISSSEVWDLRTYHLLRTVPSLNLCDVIFNSTNDVIFGVADPNEMEEDDYNTSFKVIDAINYSSIATVDTRRVVSSLSINSMDSQLAIVEANGFQDDLDEVTTCRLYDIAMTRQEEDDDPLSDEEDDINSDDDDDDSDDTDDEDQAVNDGANDDSDDSSPNDEDIFDIDDVSYDEENLSNDSDFDNDGDDDDDDDDDEDVEANNDDDSDSESVLFELSTDDHSNTAATTTTTTTTAAADDDDRSNGASGSGQASWPRRQSAEGSSRNRRKIHPGSGSRATRTNPSTTRNSENQTADDDEWEDIADDEEEES
ncbi:DDB1- and CUL4-associated factor 1 [Hyalella azteca]|uniref:DDB1- and CUL4-associated factor 1 n=1 Tax=Hyalella azteca TaxID=294128 RepID=A0A979FWA6_HYAAZ|nr:DDB1- and CUL4-associated factor 1 [Hyalella azteca]